MANLTLLKEKYLTRLPSGLVRTDVMPVNPDLRQRDYRLVLDMPGIDQRIGDTILFDRSGIQPPNHGTIVGATWRSANGLMTLRYDGDDYVNIDVVLPELANTKKGTWMTWVKLDDATPATSANIITFGDTSASEYILMQITTTGLLYCALNIAGVGQWRLDTDASVISDYTWVHLALIQDGVAPVLLVNGEAVAQAFLLATNTTAWFADCAGIDNGRIGCFNYNAGGNIAFITNGNTGFTRIANYDLTQERIQAIVASELGWWL